MNWSTRTFAAAVGACFALAACSASGMPPSSGFQNGSPSLLRASSAPPTLYVLNRQVSKTVGWVSVYANAGATFTRKFGTLGEEGAYVAADQAGHVYLYTGRVPGQVQIYEKYGKTVSQTLQYHKGIFSTLTLDDAGNLFAMVKKDSPKYIAGPLDEFASSGHGMLSTQALVRHDIAPYWIATDSMGDVASAGGINGFTAYTRKSKAPFWTLRQSGMEYLAIAFDPSANLYVVQEPESSQSVSLEVYARGASTPSYLIPTGVYVPTQLTFDGSGNLYVLDYCPSNCGSNPTSAISIYGPGATSATTVLQPPAGNNFGEIAVSGSGYVAAVEYQTGSYNGPVVVYAPGTTTPSITISSGLQAVGQVVFGK